MSPFIQPDRLLVEQFFQRDVGRAAQRRKKGDSSPEGVVFLLRSSHGRCTHEWEGGGRQLGETTSWLRMMEVVGDGTGGVMAVRPAESQKRIQRTSGGILVGCML